MGIRVIPCLDIKDGRVVKGIQFIDIKDAGDPVEVAKAYDAAGADELMLLDIGASNEGSGARLDLVERIIKEISIPITIGGGINKLQDFKELLDRGVNKVSISSAAIRNPQLISEVANKLGSQYIIVAIDGKKTGQGKWSVFSNGGKINTHKDVVNWAVEVESLGAGQILLTSMDGDGTKNGYDIELTKAVTNNIDIPVIASGGAGRLEHFRDVIIHGGADAVLAASLFHYKELEIAQLKYYLTHHGISIAKKEGKYNGKKS
ncbi:MAG TPA: imidazole glycerol phosphate synthase subunit HisF [Clostridia bacterium]|nr:imidazole glycerol phosphate synthase subunit HisF [Clostridia bacterium]